MTTSFLKSEDSSQYFGRSQNAVIWMVSTRPPTSKSSSPLSNPLITVPNAPITIGIIVTCMFHSLFIIIMFTPLEFFTSVLIIH